MTFFREQEITLHYVPESEKGKEKETEDDQDSDATISEKKKMKLQQRKEALERLNNHILNSCADKMLQFILIIVADDPMIRWLMGRGGIGALYACLVCGCPFDHIGYTEEELAKIHIFYNLFTIEQLFQLGHRAAPVSELYDKWLEGSAILRNIKKISPNSAEIEERKKEQKELKRKITAILDDLLHPKNGDFDKRVKAFYHSVYNQKYPPKVYSLLMIYFIFFPTNLFHTVQNPN